MMDCAFMPFRLLHLYLESKYQSNLAPYYDCTMTKTTFGNRVRERRNELDIAQEDLAKAAGISQSTVAQIESGRNKGTKHILALARALRVRPEWLENESGEMLLAKHVSGTGHAPITAPKTGLIARSPEGVKPTITEKKPLGYGNVGTAVTGHREIPVISYVQAGMMTEAVDPFLLGDGFETISTDLDVSSGTFGLIIKGPSMEPDFKDGDKVIVDPAVTPQPGDFVVAKNTEEEATFKKYRPRGTSERGEQIFELVPLNDDFATLHSERDHLHIIGVMVEHRKYRRR